MVVARIDQLGAPGFSVYVPPARAAVLTAALVDAGARVASQDAIEAARIEARYPLFGIDMTEDTIPLEAGIEDRAISTDEGLLRRPGSHHPRAPSWARARGQEARGLDDRRTQARAGREASLPPAARWVGLRVQRFRTARRTVALGYVHRDFLSPGPSLRWPPRGLPSPSDCALDGSGVLWELGSGLLMVIAPN